MDSVWRRGQKKDRPVQSTGRLRIPRWRPTLPQDHSSSTIGAVGLNDSVRNGKRCFPYAMTTEENHDKVVSELCLSGTINPKVEGFLSNYIRFLEEKKSASLTTY